MGVRALLAASAGPPPIDTSYPTPGSGTYRGASLALDGISYAC